MQPLLKCNLLCCRYEDLKNDTYSEVVKTLDFLGIKYSPEEVKRKLEQDFNAFKRLVVYAGS